MGSAKSAGAVLLLLSFFLYVADSYPNFPKSNSKISSEDSYKYCTFDLCSMTFEFGCSLPSGL